MPTLLLAPRGACAGPPLRFAGTGEAMALLRRFRRDPDAIGRMRAVASRCGFAPARASDDELTAWLAVALVQRRVEAMLVQPRVFHGVLSPGADEAAPGEAVAPEWDVQPEKYWVEFRLLDGDGDPLAGEPFVASLADGRRVSGRLDADGAARWNDVASEGACSITFPEVDASCAWVPGEGADGRTVVRDDAPTTTADGDEALYVPGSPPPPGATGKRHTYRLPTWDVVQLDLVGDARDAVVPPPAPPREDDEHWDIETIEAGRGE